VTETCRKPNLSPSVKRYALLLAAAWTLCAAPGFAGETRTQHVPFAIGTALDYPPYSFLDEHGEPTGYNVDLTEAIAEVMELDVEVKIGPWADIRNALETGELDAVAGMFYSVGRDKLVDFSPPYTVVHHAIFVRRDAPGIETEEDLRGKDIIVMRGGIMHDYVMENGLCDNPVLADTPADVLRLLASGKHDCALVAKLPGLCWSNELGLSNIMAVGPLLRPSDYSYAVAEGNGALLARLAEGLAVVGETGRYKQIYDKWLGVMEPRGVSLATVIMYIALAAAPVLLLLTVFVVWSQFLKRQVDRRTAELKEETIEHKRAAEALAEKERYFRSQLYSIHDAIMVVDRDYVVTDVNNSVLATTGLGREEIVGRHCYEVTHGYSDPCSEHGESCFLHKVFETGEPSSSVHQHLSADGSTVWVDMLLSPLRDREGNVTHVIESARDITDTTSARNALRESEEKQHELLATVPDAIMTFDGETRRFVEVNQSALDLYGYTREQFLQLTQTDITAEPEASDISIRETLRAKRQHVPVRYHKKKDGTVFPVEISTNAFDLAGRQVVCEAVRDITERLRAEQEMASLVQFTDENPNPVMRLGPDGSVIYVNAAGDPLLEALECGTDRVVPHDWQKLVNKVLDSGSVENTELMVLDRTFVLTFTPVVEAGYVNVYGLDITELKRAEEENRRLEAQFVQAQKMESIGRLAGGIAHDFNNLLTGLIGYTQLVQQQLDDNPALRHDVGRIGSLAARAARLTRRLLAFSRRQTLDPVPLDLNDLVSNSLKMLRRIIGEDIEIKFEPAPDLETVRADPDQIEQILMNLAVNARDAMPSGGTILIRTANASFDKQYLQEHVGVKPGSYVTLDVTDTGCGINPETKDKVFEPFFTTKKAGQGTGLGLAVVYEIVKQHGGNIWVYSEPGKGTTFKMYLPRLEKSVEPKTERTVREIVPTGTETVLLVEDELSVQHVETRMLNDIGYTVLVSSTVHEAEALFAEHGDEVDMIVSDIVLPDGYGPQLYKRLAEHKPGLKVLFVSGYNYEAVKSRGVKDMDTPFLEKPFTLAALARKLRDVLSTEQMGAGDEQNVAQQTSVA